MMRLNDNVWCVCTNLTILPGRVTRLVSHYADDNHTSGVFVLPSDSADNGLFAPDASSAVLFPIALVFTNRGAAVAAVNRFFESIKRRTRLDRLDDSDE